MFRNLKALYAKVFGDTPITTHSYSVRGTGYGIENLLDTRNLNTYKESLYLYRGVTMIAKRVAGVPLELHRIKNIKGETEEVFDHPLLELLSSPNGLQTKREFLEVSVAHYLLSGDTFWYMNRNGRQVDEMIPLMPNLVEIILSPDKKNVVGYEYKVGQVYRFQPEDIIHIKNPDATNYLHGVGVIRPASTRIATEKEANLWQANWFANQARPDIAVLSDRPATQEVSDLFSKMWKEKFGKKGESRVALFGNDTRDIKELNKTPKEMDFIETQRFLRNDIAFALGIPQGMFDNSDSNLGNGKDAMYRIFLQEAVVPVLDAFVDVMNHRMAPRFDERVFWTYEDPTPADREMKLREITELKKNGIITANEGRAEYDYEQHEDGDALGTNNNNARIEVQEEARSILRSRPLLVKRMKAAVSLTNALTEPKRQMNSIFPTKELKARYAKAVNDRIDRKAETLKDAIDQYHKGLEERVLASDLSADGFMDKSEERRIAKDALGPVVARLYKEGGQAALDDVFAKSADTFFSDEVMLAAIAERVNFFTESMTDTTFDVLKGVIVDGIREGQAIEEIGRRIRDQIRDMSVGRARTIAQTETNYALSKATNDAYQQSSVVTGKEWISAGDSKVRPGHQDNAAQAPIPKGAAFSNGEEWPGQHSVNCRCVLAPAV